MPEEKRIVSLIEGVKINLRDIDNTNDWIVFAGNGGSQFSKKLARLEWINPSRGYIVISYADGSVEAVHYSSDNRPSDAILCYDGNDEGMNRKFDMSHLEGYHPDLRRGWRGTAQIADFCGWGISEFIERYHSLRGGYPRRLK